MRTTFFILTLFFSLSLASAAFAGAKSEVKKGNLLYNKENYQGALDKYQGALKDKPNSDIVNYNLGNAQYKLKDYVKAIENYSKSLLSQDEILQQKANYNLGNAEYKHGIGFEEKNLDQAISLLKQSLRHYEKAMELNSEDSDAKYNHEFVKNELERLEKKKEQQKQEQKEQEKKEKQKSQEQQQEQQKQQQQQQQQDQEQKQEQQQGQKQEQSQEEKEQQEQQNQEQQEQQEKEQQQQQQKKISGQEDQSKEQQARQEQSEKELKEEEAKALLEDYRLKEEPKGLYKEKMPARDYGEVYKDW